MADLIRYDILVQKAMREVVRKVIQDVIEAGNELPGEHHFYITFDTTHPHVRISERLHRQYPDQMTIVLQHQFWDLKVSEETIEVSLSFDQHPENLKIPFQALIGFYDPSASFGLQFETMEEPKDPLSQNQPSKNETLVELSNDDNEDDIIRGVFPARLDLENEIKGEQEDDINAAAPDNKQEDKPSEASNNGEEEDNDQEQGNENSEANDENKPKVISLDQFRKK